MLKIKECKARARSVLLGRYGTMICACLLSSLISILLMAAAVGCLVYSAICSGIFSRFSDSRAAFSFGTLIGGVLIFSVLTVASTIIGVLLGMGRKRLMLNICRGRSYGVSDVFYAFSKGSRPWKYILSVIIIWAISFAGNLIPNLISSIAELILGDTLTAAVITIVVQLVFTVATVIILMTFFFASIILIDKPETGLSEAFGLSAKLMKGRKLKGFWLKNFSFLLWNLLGVICPLIMLWITPYYECTMTVMYMDADDTLWQLPSGRSVDRSGDGQGRQIIAAQEAVSGVTPVNDAAGEDMPVQKSENDDTSVHETSEESVSVQEEAIRETADSEVTNVNISDGIDTAAGIPKDETAINEAAINEAAVNEAAGEEAVLNETTGSENADNKTVVNDSSGDDAADTAESEEKQ